MSLGLCFHTVGRLDDAAAEFRHLPELDENHLAALYWLTRNLVAQDMIPEASPPPKGRSRRYAEQ
jgi:hypothetical protein